MRVREPGGRLQRERPLGISRPFRPHASRSPATSKVGPCIALPSDLNALIQARGFAPECRQIEFLVATPDSALATENRLLGASRIHGELLKLGIASQNARCRVICPTD